jgi:hypothetical protein
LSERLELSGARGESSDFFCFLRFLSFSLSLSLPLSLLLIFSFQKRAVAAANVTKEKERLYNKKAQGNGASTQVISVFGS